MRTTLARSALALLLVASGATDAGAQPAARADEAREAREAREAFEEGLALEKRGEHAAALVRFQDAARRRPTPGVRFHEAYCLEMTGKLLAAMRTYELAEDGARAQGKVDTQKAIDARLPALRERLPKLALRMSGDGPPATSLTVDDAVVSPDALDGRPIPVDPGHHVITARSATGRVAEVTVDVAVSTTTEATLAYAPEPVAPATRPPPVANDRPSRVLPVALAGGAVVAVGGGVLAFVLAGNAADDARAACPTKTRCDDERSEVRTLDALALGGFVAGAGLGALSVYLFARGERGVHVGVAPRALVVEGRF